MEQKFTKNISAYNEISMLSHLSLVVVVCVLISFRTFTLGVIKCWHHTIIKYWLFDVRFVLLVISVKVFSWDVLIRIMLLYYQLFKAFFNLSYNKDGLDTTGTVSFNCSNFWSKKLITRMVLWANRGGPDLCIYNLH